MQGVAVKAQLMDASDLDRTIARMARQILEYCDTDRSDMMVLVGIQTRGVFLAQRLKAKIRAFEGLELPIGVLDATLYRDDFRQRSKTRKIGLTQIPFDLSERDVVLVDDVINTGRTVRAAMDALMDLGRPSIIRLLIMIDREHREVPIRADIVGRKVPTIPGEEVRVRLREIDARDGVWLVQRSE
ncbi:MAG: bifunctional pyr operon transcriptional regulator/uracil phosphoribosyltransferase PyrR [Bacteroidota bacterium]|nr:bifunctional pyr operon transcriptional regulator/uracil phosphoribosyltransferase PyrR [Bacteroidota bacterium]MDE2833261.1 bifunctional pyr operon transcriptional regulator/uracil phosphoribosyltransferase PyrR [Bacteroidota bacterium]MDE2957672.1 bifunctional pyr operon transcriptional regulator/uracil phosphoribosyltransferase PyrR [Bacteroidota bacterium]